MWGAARVEVTYFFVPAMATDHPSMDMHEEIVHLVLRERGGAVAFLMSGLSRLNVRFARLVGRQELSERAGVRSRR